MIKTPTSPPAFFLPVHPFGVSPKWTYDTPPSLWHTHFGTSRLPIGAPFDATPERAHATSSLHWSTHVALSRLPTGIPIWYNSRRCPCHASSPLAHPLRHQLSTYQRTHLVQIPGEAHVRLSLLCHTHAIPSRLSLGALLGSFLGGAHDFYSREHRCRHQPSTYQYIHFVLFQEGPMEYLPSFDTLTSSPAVYLPTHPFGAPPGRTHSTLFHHQNTHAAPIRLPTGALI